MARPKQETLVLFPDILNITRKFTDAQFGALMRAAFSYRFGGELYAGDDAAVDVAFQVIAGQVDRYNVVCAVNAGNRKNPDADSGTELQEMQGNSRESQETPENPPHTHTHSHIHNGVGDTAAEPPTRKRFVPPTVQDVADYCRGEGYTVDAGRFVDYYTANGWRVGKNPMRNWRAAVRTWASKEKPTAASATPGNCGYTLAPLEDPFEVAIRKEGLDCSISR